MALRIPFRPAARAVVPTVFACALVAGLGLPGSVAATVAADDALAPDLLRGARMVPEAPVDVAVAPEPVLVAEAAPEDPVDRLTRALDGLDLLEASFTQTIADGRGTVLRSAAGSLWAARPDRFRWEIETPFAEVLVGDGQTLYLWDPDLEQVTIRPYDERLRGTPARLLSGSAEDLVDTFDVSLIADDADREVFELRPREGDGLFERLELVFASGLPRALVIHDSLGQRTEVILDGVRVGAEPVPGRFEFEIPEGADVLREEAEGAADSAHG